MALKTSLQDALSVGQSIAVPPPTKVSLTSSGKSLFAALVLRPNYW